MHDTPIIGLFFTYDKGGNINDLRFANDVLPAICCCPVTEH